MSAIEITLAEQEAARTKELAASALKQAEIAGRRLELLRQKESHEENLRQIQKTLDELNSNSASIEIVVDDRPKLILPKLLDDLSDFDAGCRDHLDPQTEQIIGIFKKLTSPEAPFIRGKDLKQYIRKNFSIEHPTYWMARTSPREPERWWKNIYDKAIERLDLSLGLIIRTVNHGKRGRYALAEYVNQTPPLFPTTSII